MKFKLNSSGEVPGLDLVMVPIFLPIYFKHRQKPMYLMGRKLPMMSNPEYIPARVARKWAEDPYRNDRMDFNFVSVNSNVFVVTTMPCPYKPNTNVCFCRFSPYGEGWVHETDLEPS